MPTASEITAYDAPPYTADEALYYARKWIGCDSLTLSGADRLAATLRVYAEFLNEEAARRDERKANDQ